MTLYSMTMILFLVCNPIGNIPLFLIVLKRCPAKRYRWIVLRETLIAWALLCVFALFGQSFLSDLHVTDASFSIAGGMVLLMVALKLVFPSSGDADDFSGAAKEPFMVPLATPFLAGFGGLATVLLMASKPAIEMHTLIMAISLTMLISLCFTVPARIIQRVIGDDILNAIARLVGMMLVTISIQMMIDGVLLVVKGMH